MKRPIKILPTQTVRKLVRHAAQLALKEGFALKSTRIWFHKFGTAKYISHLDLNRCVARAFHKAKLPMWYTEGFNPHAFVTFALPLSLGVEGKHESMDIRLLEDMPKEEIIHRLNDYLDKYKMTVEGHEVVLNIVLPAGSTENVNPSLIGEAIQTYLGYSLYAVIIRSHLYDAEFHIFA